MPRIRYISFLAINFRFLLILSLAAAPLSAQSLPQHPAAQPAPPETARPVVELIALGPGSHGKNRECQATGFLVNEEGYILTNAHVVDEARECLANAPAEHILAKPLTAGPDMASAVPCELVVRDDLHDLALLRAERRLFGDNFKTGAGSANAHAITSFLLLDATVIEDGTSVAVTGHPAFAWHAETRSGRINGHGSMALSDTSTVKSEVLYLDIPLLKGSSGSPVYRASDGSVVGIVERKDLKHPGRTIAVPIGYAIEMLSRVGVKWHSPQPSALPD